MVQQPSTHWLLDWLLVGAAWALIAFIVVMGFALYSSARPHDSAEWIQRLALKNALGELCCGPRDCDAIAENGVSITASGYLIKSSNETVPFNEALPLPNIPEAKGLYWRCYWGGKRKCFFAPHGGV